MPDTTNHITWEEGNRRYLTAALAVVRDAIARNAVSKDATVPDTAGASVSGARRNELEEAARGLSSPPALDHLVANFGLTPFEREVLLICAGVELDTSFAAACREAGAMPPTFGLALAVSAEPHWSALTPNGPLRRWRLIDVAAGETLTASGLRIEEPVLHFLAGIPQLDERLGAMTDEVDRDATLAPSQTRHVGQIAQLWSDAASNGDRLPVVRLSGRDRDAATGVAAEVCAALGLTLRRIPARMVPNQPADLDLFCRLWERDSALHSLALLVDASNLPYDDPLRSGVLPRLLDEAHTPILVIDDLPVEPRRRRLVSVDVGKPSPEEQRELWNASLPGYSLNGEVERLTTQFDLGGKAIRRVVDEAIIFTSSTAPEGANPEGAAPDGNTLADTLWDACRAVIRYRLDDLAQRIEPSAGWDDLILPDRQKSTLREMALQARNRGTVYERWGFARAGNRGFGISALFAGASGVGKTMAAEVIARELRLDLYRIDLSAVVSKYIGETEKNLKKIFDAADEGGVLLLFDEADALFGKRSEVKDSHDRYANIEVSYLLQRMEAYRGIAVLTTNMKGSLDSAFLRRIRFIVQFPFPDAASRAEIWRRVFPKQTPTDGLDPLRLAQLNATGGHIRNIALTGAFLAAEAGEPVRMKHLLDAARTEMTKLEKPLPANEIRGWE